jgi:hypothetical protein
MDRIRNHITFANVISLCALMVALGGTAYAGLNLPKNSVGSRQIKPQAVKAGKIKPLAVKGGKLAPNSVNGSKVADGSVGLLDLGPNSVDGTKLADGSVGLADLAPDSVDSSKVANGSVAFDDAAAGAFLNGTVTVQFEQAAADLGNGAEQSLDVHCPAGQTAIGGGTRGDLTNSELTKVTASRPITAVDNTGAPGDNGTFTGWRGTFVNENNGAGIRPEVWVICTGPTPPAP